MINLWVEKYRPRSVDEFVWASPNLKNCFVSWIAAGEVPNVLFSGGAGRGKTTLARMLMLALDIPSCDVLDINASLERRVDGFTDTITNFTSTWAMGDKEMKYVILDEADRLSNLSQDFLRNEIEKHHSTCRFILTCNQRQKISGPLHSRLQEFEFAALDRDEAVMRAAKILVSENIDFDPETLIKYVNAYYPDLRKSINVLQQRSNSGKLQEFNETSADATDYFVEILSHVVAGNSKQARAIIAEQSSSEDYISIFNFFYTNIAIFDDVNIQDRILIAIRDGMWRHSTVANTEINMAATIAEIAYIARGGK